MTFESLKIHPSIIKGLKDVGITEVKEIYKELLQLDHRKGSALIKSSGSSLDELLLPIVHHLAESDEKQAKPSRIGILCPTANRAIEIEQWVWAVGYHAKIRCSRVTQREEKTIQEQALKSEPTVVVGDPGRLLDFISDGIWELGGLDKLVIVNADELDRYKMFNKVKKIAKSIGPQTQMYVQAQTYNATVESLLAFMPVHTKCIGFESLMSGVGPAIALNSRVHNYYCQIPERSKISTLMSHLEDSKTQRIVVSAYSRKTIQRLFKVIRKKNWGVVSIDSSATEELKRERLSNYYDKDFRILLYAGLSIEELHLHGIGEIIYYDIPDDIFELVRSMQLLDYGYKKQVVSLLYQDDLKAFLEVSKGIGLAPIKIPLPKRSPRNNQEDAQASNQKAQGKSRAKHNDGQKAKYKNKNSIKGTPTSNQQKKKGTKKQSTYEEVEAPRVNLEELDQKRKQKRLSKSKKGKTQLARVSVKQMKGKKTGPPKNESSENPVKRFFKRLF